MRYCGKKNEKQYWNGNSIFAMLTIFLTDYQLFSFTFHLCLIFFLFSLLLCRNGKFVNLWLLICCFMKENDSFRYLNKQPRNISSFNSFCHFLLVALPVAVWSFQFCFNIIYIKISSEMDMDPPASGDAQEISINA